MKVEFDLSNYVTKADWKNATSFDTSKFAKKVNLANLKPEVNKLDVDKFEKVRTYLNSLQGKVDQLDLDKLAPVPVDLSKLIGVIRNNVVKKDDVMLRSKILKIKYLILLT